VRLFKQIAKWAAMATMLFGAATMFWALIMIVRFKTGWAVSDLQLQNPDDWAKVALSLLLSGMFFFLVGSGLLLVTRMDRPASDPNDQPPRWTKPVTVSLYVCGFGSIALATVFAGMTKEFGDATAGIVSYCMLMGVGLLFSGWGLKRAGDREEATSNEP
jgi:hypothetical protein